MLFTFSKRLFQQPHARLAGKLGCARCFFPHQTAFGGLFRVSTPLHPRLRKPNAKKRTTIALPNRVNGWCVQLSFAAASGEFPKFEAVIDCAACRERQAGFSRLREYTGSEGAFAVVDEDFD